MTDYVTNHQLDRAIQAIERSIDSLAHMISRTNETNERLVEKVVTLENQIKDFRYDLIASSKVLDGDGNHQGLKVQIQLILKDIEDIKSRLDRSSMVRLEDQQENKKAGNAKQIALISGGIAGLIEFIKFLTEIFGGG